MAELITAKKAVDPCCAPEAQPTCCEPSAKDKCCRHEESCDCAAGATGEQAGDLP